MDAEGSEFVEEIERLKLDGVESGRRVFRVDFGLEIGGSTMEDEKSVASSYIESNGCELDILARLNTLRMFSESRRLLSITGYCPFRAGSKGRPR